jgi:hypothetical protein
LKKISTGQKLQKYPEDKSCKKYPEDKSCKKYPEDKSCRKYPEDKSCKKYPNTRFVFNNVFPENHVAYNNLGGGGEMVETDRPQMTM